MLARRQVCCPAGWLSHWPAGRRHVRSGLVRGGEYEQLTALVPAGTRPASIASVAAVNRRILLGVSYSGDRDLT
jgi:hypothetical protein